MYNNVYPLQLSTLKNGLTLYVPDPALVKPTYQKLVAENTETIFPYWAKIWASSDAMIQFLQDEPAWIQNKIVLEIGAGIGVPSFCVASQTKKITISDYAPDAVLLLQKNIEHLQLQNVEAMQLDWNAIPENLQPEVLILSDVNYDPTQFETLTKLIEKFLH